MHTASLSMIVRRYGIPLVLGMAGAVVAAVWLIGDPRAMLRHRAIARELHVLQTVLPHVWRGEARIIGGAASVVPTAAADQTVEKQRQRQREIEVDLAVATLRQIAEPSADARAWNALGVGYALQRRMEDAIGAFERAAFLAPGNAETLTNLSAASAMRGEPRDRIKALDAALQAVDSHGAPPEAWFNAALAAERVLPPEDAEIAWKKALAHEPSSDWRRRIEERLARVRPVASTQDPGPEAIRQALDYEVLPQWAAACRSGADGSGLALRARDLIAALGRYTGDRYLPAVASWLGATEGNGICVPERAAAFGDFVAAREAYELDRRDTAMLAFAPLVSRLDRLRSPSASSARVYLAICRYFTAMRDQSAGLLDLAAAGARARHYHDVLGRADWMRGYIAEDRNALERARQAYESASLAFRLAANADGERSVGALLASLSDTLGDYREGWRIRESALEGLRPGADRRGLHVMLHGATRAALRDGLGHAALAFATVRTAAARSDRSPIRIVDAAIEQARVHRHLGQHASARRTLDEAAEVIPRIEVAGIRSRHEANLRIARAQAADDPVAAYGLLTDVLSAYATTGSELLRGQLHLQRGRAALARRDEAAAEQDFLAGIDVFEGVRRQLASAPTRLSYFEEAWQLFDELVDLRVAQRRFVPALEALERGRASTLRDTVQSRVSPDALARALPSGATVLSYAVLENELVVWVLRGGVVRAAITPVSRQRIQSLVASSRFETAIGATSALARLYDLLVAPVEADLAGVDRVYIVPDPLLHYVSFAALWRAASRQHLIERHAVVLLPSIGVARADTSSGDRQTDAALIVAAADAGLGDGLPRLPAAEREGAALAALYPRGRLLADRDLGKTELLAHARDYPVLHFAGHAVVNPEVPQLSRLLLSQDAQEGRLYAHDLETLDLRQLQTVVLAACSTAAGRTYRSEGVVSLARTFVGRGVGRVVATLWEIDDAEASALFRAFHRRMRAGRTAEDAVADVQREAIRAGRPSIGWRGVVVISRIVR